MQLHLAYSFVVILMASAGFRRVPLLLALTYPIFLLRLPPTETDFPIYQLAFDQVRFNTSSSNWIQGGSRLTSEPAWKWYNALLKPVALDNFRYFLVLNYWISLALIWASVRRLQVVRDHLNLALALMVPVVFPTIFFWSPRSSISFALCLYGAIALMNHRVPVALLAMAAGASIHSQFLPICLFLLLVSLKPHRAAGRNYLRAGVAFIATLASILVAEQVLQFVEFLPSIEILSAKVRQFDDVQTGFRTTGLISIIALPVLTWMSRNWWKESEVGTLVINLTVFAVGVNIVFFNAAHLAGRLARLADFLLLPLLVAGVVVVTAKRFDRILPLTPAIAAVPFVYTTLY